MHFSTVIALSIALIQCSYAAPPTAFAGALSKRAVDGLPSMSVQCRRSPSLLDPHLPWKPPHKYFPRLTVATAKHEYSVRQIEEATQQGISTVNNPVVPLDAKGNYPKNFRNKEGFSIPNCKDKELWEFPILNGGLWRKGDKPGADRVIFTIETSPASLGTATDGVYCAVLTHEGAPTKNGFLACDRSIRVG